MLDKLLKEGGWLRRVSAGWLPASYLRTMPSYYRGISPVVIDHDHGNAPGINGGHSEVKPELPPVRGAARPNSGANPIHPNFHPYPNPKPKPNPKPHPKPHPKSHPKPHPEQVESFELCDPDGWGRKHEPAPREWSAEEAEENAADGDPGAGAAAAAEDEDAIQLPEGTCKSTAAEDTPGATKDQVKGWNAWCDLSGSSLHP